MIQQSKCTKIHKKPKILTIWLFIKKVCQPQIQTTIELCFPSVILPNTEQRIQNTDLLGIFIDYSLLLLCLFPLWQQPQENSLRTGIYYFYYVPSKSHLLSSTSLSSMKLEIFWGSNKDFQRTSCVKAGVALAYLREYRGKREVA